MSVLSRSVGDIVQLWSLLSVLVYLAGLWSWSCENGLAYVTARSSRVDVSYLERPLLQSTPCHPRRHYDTCPTEAHWNGGRDAAAGAPRAAIVHRVKATTTTTAVPQPAPPPHAAAADNDDKPAHNRRQIRQQRPETRGMANATSSRRQRRQIGRQQQKPPDNDDNSTDNRYATQPAPFAVDNDDNSVRSSVATFS